VLGGIEGQRGGPNDRRPIGSYGAMPFLAPSMKFSKIRSDAGQSHRWRWPLATSRDCPPPPPPETPASRHIA
jgi:hypothetical protein